MQDLLAQNYYGNNLQTWLIALAIMVGSALLGKLVYWFFSKIVRAFTSRSKTQIDDIIVDMIEEPVVFMIIASGIWVGLRTLALPERLSAAIGNSYQVIVALLVGWLVTKPVI